MSEIEYADWMSETDALMWHMERDPILRSTIGKASVARLTPDPGRRCRLGGCGDAAPALRDSHSASWPSRSYSCFSVSLEQDSLTSLIR